MICPICQTYVTTECSPVLQRSQVRCLKCGFSGPWAATAQEAIKKWEDAAIGGGIPVLLDALERAKGAEIARERQIIAEKLEDLCRLEKLSVIGYLHHVLDARKDLPSHTKGDS